MYICIYIYTYICMYVSLICLRRLKSTPSQNVNFGL